MLTLFDELHGAPPVGGEEEARIRAVDALTDVLCAATQDRETGLVILDQVREYFETETRDDYDKDETITITVEQYGELTK